jgi:hypothetical protein
MKNLSCSIWILLIVGLAVPVSGWEFNEDGKAEGWFAGSDVKIPLVEVADGVMTAHLAAGVNDPFINGPSAALDANDVTGLYIRNRWSVDASGAGGISLYWFNPGPANTAWTPSEPNVWSTSYVSLADNENWSGTVNRIRLDLADGIADERTVEFDWIRYGGLYLDNESFEVWDVNEDRIAAWDIVGPNDAFAFDEANEVYSLDWAVRGIGTGDYGAITQPVKGGLVLDQGVTVMLSGAVKIPADSWDGNASLWFRLNETNGTEEQNSPEIQVPVFDEWFEFETALTLAYAPGERQGLNVQCYARLAEGKVFYFDDIFVTDIKAPEFVDEDLFWRYRQTHWEFNTPGDPEGWSNPNEERITYFSVERIDPNGADIGALLLDLPGGTFDPMINGPAGPYYASKTQGFAARVRFIGEESDLAKPADGGQHTFYWFNTAGGHGNSPQFEIPGADQWFTLYVDCSDRWQSWFNNFRMDFGHYANLTLVDIDWIRLYGDYLMNSGFEDGTLDPWAHRGAGDLGAFQLVSEPSDIVPLGTALKIDGLGAGTYHAVAQAVPDWNRIPKGAEVTLRGMYYVPGASWEAGSELWFRVREFDGTPPENLTGSIVEPVLDRWVPFESTLTTQFEPDGERTDLSIQLYSRTPAGGSIYVDDVFVEVRAAEPGAAPEPTWPVNAVHLGAGQTITVDGRVSAAEYAGAQVLTLNADSLTAEDPHFAGVTHAGIVTDTSQPTPPEDYTGSFYFMWDDTYLYAALVAQDDHYSFVGPNPNGSDCLQFVLGALPAETATASMFIPTVAPDGGNGAALGKNDFPGWIGKEIMAQSEYAGSVDAANNQWTVELRIPWTALQGEWANTAFPPAAGDTIGFSVLGIDYDNSAQEWFGCTHNAFPWQSAGLQSLTFVE